MNYTQGKGGPSTQEERYLRWIADYIHSVDTDPHYTGDNWTLASKLRGHCISASHKLQEAFPELRLIRGTVVSTNWIKRMGINVTEADELQSLIRPDGGHIWCETETGEVVDPTFLQFAFVNDVALYVPFDESKAADLPTGKCPNCGDYCYHGKELCSEECERSYARYLASECRF